MIVVKIIGAQLLEMAGGGGRLKQLGTQPCKNTHGPAAVDEQQDTDSIPAGFPVFDLQKTVFPAGALSS